MKIKTLSILMILLLNSCAALKDFRIGEDRTKPHVRCVQCHVEGWCDGFQSGYNARKDEEIGAETYFIRGF